MKTTKRSTFKVLIHFKKNAPKKNGMVLIMCRITVNGKQSTFSAKLDISDSTWDLKYGRVSGKSKESQNLNAKLDSIRMGIEKCYSKIMEDGGSANSDKLKDFFLGMESRELTFFKFFDRFVLDFEKKVDSGVRANGTFGKYKSL